ncbi:MAG TPA: helix-turn-helix domain-containing protein [Patescibacteria group bacterium]|nr:helix-turn-helix domain-containing protein [Patescibacteria group bacterium]
MSRLVASEHGLRALVALSQRPEGLRPAEVATILGIPFSSAERALRVLEHDGLVEHRDRRFALRAGARSRAAVRFALAMVEPAEALSVLAGASSVVEFAGTDDDGAVLVIRRFADPAGEVLLHAALADLAVVHGELRVELLDKSALRERLLDDRAPRDRAVEMRVLAGSVDRSFPDRTRHGDENAPLLRRLHDGVVVPSDRRLHALARRHGLRRMVAFGSATRADFRPDSDLDLLVEPLPGRRFGLRQRAALVADAETLFERDVDLVAAGEARPALAERIAREGVVLHGPAVAGAARRDA